MAAEDQPRFPYTCEVCSHPAILREYGNMQTDTDIVLGTNEYYCQSCGHSQHWQWVLDRRSETIHVVPRAEYR